MMRYTKEVYYVARSEITHLMDEHLLTKVQREKLAGQYIDIYTVAAAPVQPSGPSTAGDKKQSEAEANSVQYKVKSISSSGG